jgi:hypothetical protein
MAQDVAERITSIFTSCRYLHVEYYMHACHFNQRNPRRKGDPLAKEIKWRPVQRAFSRSQAKELFDLWRKCASL